MTIGKQQDTSDREALSALFDGELSGDAARFAHRRLAHDRQWHQAAGRWQLAGDVLRGQAAAVAPPSLADRVRVAMEQEAGANAAVAAGGTGGHGRRWFGGAALAASVAVAALFVARPLSEATAPVPEIATAPAVGAAPSLAAQDPAPEAPPAPVRSPAEIGLAAAAAAVAVAEVPRREGERSRRRAAPPADVRVAHREQQAPRVASIDGPGDGVAGASAAVADTVGTQPLPGAPPTTASGEALALELFLPDPQVESRPWPRAPLPGYPAARELTAGFSAQAQGAPPSFYPFEPRIPLGLEASDAAQPAADPARMADWPQP